MCNEDLCVLYDNRRRYIHVSNQTLLWMNILDYKSVNIADQTDPEQQIMILCDTRLGRWCKYYLQLEVRGCTDFSSTFVKKMLIWSIIENRLSAFILCHCIWLIKRLHVIWNNNACIESKYIMYRHEGQISLEMWFDQTIVEF